MKISVITVCFNSEKVIEEAILSVLKQKQDNLEYIVVDGKSSDGTMKILEKYKDKISILVSEKDKGIFDAMNKGVKLATGDLIYFLNSDDRFYDEDVICDIVKVAQENKDIDYLYGGVVCKNIFGGKSMNTFLKEISEFSFKCGQHIKHQSIFVKRDLFDKFGLFDISYEVSAAYEWESRLIKNHCKGLFVNRLIAYYDQTGFSSRGVWAQYIEKTKIINKHFGIFFSSIFFIQSLFKFTLTKILKTLKIAPLISKILNAIRGSSLK